MANLAVTYTLSNGQTSDASLWNQNYTDIVNYVNNRNGGSSTWDALSVLHATNIPLIVDNSTGSQSIANFRANGSNVVIIDSTGKVGIAASSLTGKLTMQSPSSGTNTIWSINDSGASAVWQFKYKDADGTFSAVPAGASYPFQINAQVVIQSPSSGTNTVFKIQDSAASANWGLAYKDSDGSLTLTPSTATYPFKFAKSLVVGTAAILTTATDGFVYLPSCAGTPTGVPTANTGTAACVYDTTGNKIWVYNGSWRGIAVA